MTNRIQGSDRLFRFSEFSLEDGVDNGLLADMFFDRHDGVVIHGALDRDLVARAVSLLQDLPTEHLFHVPVGRVFPISFATISEDPEHYSAYLKSLGLYADFVREPAISRLLVQINDVLSSMGAGYSVSPPRLLSNGFRAAEGNFRQFDPGMGGIYSHCGYLFQQQSPCYYKVIEPLRQVDQLSYFVVLQNAQEGGELTIYDLLWDNVKDKDSPMGNEFVVDVKGNRIYLSEVRQMKVRPKPGDMVIFRGGPIWHRVEDIHGPLSRITFGGFLNITEDGKGIRYYS